MFRGSALASTEARSTGFPAIALKTGTALEAGRCGGLIHQVENGVNGFTVASIDEAAPRIAELLRDAALQ
jgi:trehalose synthase